MAKRYSEVLVGLVAVGALWGGTAAARAETLWIDDTSGNIGQVNLTTDAVSGVKNTGQSLTDIGFNSAGTLYGTTFTNLYSINTSTGVATNLGSYNVGGGGVNALVGSGGTTLLAASTAATGVYTVNPASPGTSTTAYPTSVFSAGDLAFSGATLYESAVGANGNDELFDVSTDSDLGYFKLGSSTEFSGVFGLADDGTTMYAVNGTDIYSVNLTNGALTFVEDYSGSGLGNANGTAFLGEGSTAVPEPTSLALLGTALVGFGALRRRRRKAA